MIAWIKRVFGRLPAPAIRPPQTLEETSPLVVEAQYAHRMRRDRQEKLEHAYGEFLSALKREDDLRSR